jgi:hypothetical protein
VHLTLRVDQFNAVADGDRADDAALAREQGRDSGLGDPRVRSGSGRSRLGQLAQPVEPVRIPRLRHHRGEIAVGAGEHPGEPGPDDVAADEDQQTGGHVFGIARAGLAALVKECHEQLHRGCAGMIFHAADQPALLPRVARQRGKPAQQLDHTATPTGSGGLAVRDERRRHQPLRRIGQRADCGRPGLLGRPSREPLPQLAVARTSLFPCRVRDGQRWAGGVLDAHQLLPNKTSSDCGSYPVAGGGGGSSRRRARRA